MDRRRRAAAAAALTLAFAFQASLPAASTSEYSDLDTSKSEMRPMMERFAADRGNLQRFYNIAASPERRTRMRKFYEETRAALEARDFDSMSQDGKVDYVLFRNEVDHELRRLDLEAKEESENAVYLPFAATIIGLEEARQKMNPLDPVQTARALDKLNKDIQATRTALEATLRGEQTAQATQTRKIVANRAATEAGSLRLALRTWFTFYNGYDPMFTWWDEEAYHTVDNALDAYATFLRERVAGLKPPPVQSTTVATQNATQNGGGRGNGAGRGGNNAYAASIAAARAGSTDD